MKRWLRAAAVCLLLGILAGGCGFFGKDGGQYRELDYTVVKAGEIPEEVQKLMQNQGEQPFQMTYKSDGWLYIMRGYGRQKTGGYSIKIRGVGISEEKLHVKYELLGPQTKEEQKGEGSLPWVVLKLEDPGCPVMFEEAGGE